MPVYERHVFVCTRGEWCPSVDGDGLGVHAALKSAVRATDLGGRVRVNHSGLAVELRAGLGVVAVFGSVDADRLETVVHRVDQLAVHEVTEGGLVHHRNGGYVARNDARG